MCESTFDWITTKRVLERKFAGLLHDPFDKAIKPSDHVSRAVTLAMEILREEPPREDVIGHIQRHHNLDEDIHFADINASAMNRGLIPYGSSTKRLKIKFQNPLSAYAIDMFSEFKEQVPLNIRKKFSVNNYDDYKKLFRDLIKILYDAYLNNNYYFAKYLLIIPEDSRIPSSPMISHLITTAMLSTYRLDKRASKELLESFYFLYINIGGVQEFISTSRKTRDLMASSWLISWLGLKVIKFLVENFGPDSILIPWLIGVPIVDYYIFGKPIKNVNMLKYAVIPATIIAVVPKLPELTPKRLREMIIKCLEKSWQEVVESYINVLSKLLKSCKIELEETYRDRIKHELKFSVIFPKIRILALEFHEKPQGLIAKMDNKLCFNIYRAIEPGPNGLQYPHVALENFESYMRLISVAAGYIKYQEKFRMQPIEGHEPTKYKKCLACGLHNIAFNLIQQKDIWEALIKKNKIDRGEYLCHLCLMRRFFDEIVHKLLNLPEKQEPKRAAIPSTDTFGTYWLKISILAVLLAAYTLRKKSSDSLINKLKSYINDISSSVISIIVELTKMLRIPLLLDGFTCNTPLAKSLINELSKVLKEEKVIEALKTILEAQSFVFFKDEIKTLLSRYGFEDFEKIFREKFEKHYDRIEQALENIRIVLVTDKALIYGAKIILLRKLSQILGLIATSEEDKIAFLKYMLRGIGSYEEPFSEEEVLDYIPLALKPQNKFVLMRADGDNIGQWILGAKYLQWIMYLHPELHEMLGGITKQIDRVLEKLKVEDKSKCISKNILARPKPISPAILSTLSMILSHNARIFERVVRALGGFLVYTGGDDVLALLPPETWHLAYLLIRILFSRELALLSNDVLEDFKDGIYGYGMSWRATMSFGIVIAHYKTDLRLVLRESMKLLEEQSKELRATIKRNDREEEIEIKDAVSVALMSRGATLYLARGIPNVLILHRECQKYSLDCDTNGYIPVAILDRILQDEINEKIEKNLLGEIASSYEGKLDQEVLSKYQSNGEIYIGLLPNSNSLTIAEPKSVLCPLSISNTIVNLVLRENISRGGLTKLIEFYEKLLKENITKADVIKQRLPLLRYSIRRSICDKLESDKKQKILEYVMKNLEKASEMLFKIERRTKITLLELIPLAAILYRCLENCL